ncbi:nucleic acid-binding, OB-fold protein, partial [Tanacetum coccineum]
KKGWNYLSCGGGQCKKGATRQLGKWFREACNKAIDYPVIRYRLELDVANDTAHVVGVLFDEPATELVKCSAESLLASVDEVSLYLLFHYFHRYYTNLYLQSADEDSNLRVAITNLIGTTHVFELKSHTYYKYGTFKRFASWKINPTNMVEEVASSTTADENTKNPSLEFKSLAQTPSVCTPSKGLKEKKKKRSEVEESDAVV